jgi:hypothetical protein
MYYGMIDTMEVQDLQWQHVFTGIRLKAYERRLAGITVARWEGNLIGLSSLTRLAFMTLDYRREKALFSRIERMESFVEPLVSVPMKIESMKITVPIQFPPATEPMEVFVDTGNDAAIGMPKAMVQKLGYENLAAQGPVQKFVGIGGVSRNRTFILPEFRLSNVSFHQVPVVEQDDELPLTLGSGFFRNFRITFDFRKKIFFIEKV